MDELLKQKILAAIDADATLKSLADANRDGDLLTKIPPILLDKPRSIRVTLLTMVFMGIHPQ